MKAALLLESEGSVVAWQYDALAEAVAKGLEIVQVLHRPGDPAGRGLQHATARPLSWLFPRRLETRAVRSIRPLLPPHVRWSYLSAEEEAGGQLLSEQVAEDLVSTDVAICLLCTPPDPLPRLRATHGVVAYGSGRPTAEPPGLAALLRGARVQPVVVQRIDTPSSEVVATAYAPVVPHSWRQTAGWADRAAVPLLAQALASLETEGGSRPSSPRPELAASTGRLTARQVARGAATLTVRRARRLGKGLLREKRWRVGRLTVPLAPEEDLVIDPGDIVPIDVPPGHTFAADPWPAPSAGVYCEVLDARSGTGEIALWRDGRWQFVDLGIAGGHASYPQTIVHDGSVHLLPEIASVCAPVMYRMAADGVTVVDRVVMRGLEDVRLLDATLFAHQGTWYLFGGLQGYEEARLDLWTGPTPSGPFRAHPSSPVCLDPRGARMAGPVTELGGSLYRFGQDGTRTYGGRVVVHRIVQLSPGRYEESRCGSIAIRGRWGPHTVSVGDGDTWVDFYDEHTTPLAGVRRVRAAVVAARARTL